MPDTKLPEEKILTHISMDKPLYKPGEVIYARAVLVDAFDHFPIQNKKTLTFYLDSPKGDTVFEFPTHSEDGVAAFSYEIPQNLSGGTYTLRTKFQFDTYPPQEREFSIRSYRAPRLKTEIEFLKKAYGPGEQVFASLIVSRAEGGIPQNASVTAVATVDSKEVHKEEILLDKDGTCETKFVLPKTILDGEGTLVMLVRDGGVTETASKTIPIVLHRISLQCYPEGGELVKSLSSALYIEAKTPKGKPADVSGRIIDTDGNILSQFETTHEGRAKITVCPKRSGNSYKAVLDKPAGITEYYSIPEVKKNGFCLHLTEQKSHEARFQLSSTQSGKARLGIYQKEKNVFSKDVMLEAGKAQECVCTLPESLSGVLRATLYDENDLPRAERLIFQKPAHSIQVKITATPSRASIRDKITLQIETSDHTGKPVSALLALSVVDDAILETIEKRERPPRLREQILLENDVSALYDPHVYLQEDGEQKLDLLLGTQGWRRFAFYQLEEFLQTHQDKAKRVVVPYQPPPPPMPRMRGVMLGAAPAGAAMLPIPPMAAMPPDNIAPQGAIPAQEMLEEQFGGEEDFQILDEEGGFDLVAAEIENVPEPEMERAVPALPQEAPLLQKEMDVVEDMLPKKPGFLGKIAAVFDRKPKAPQMPPKLKRPAPYTPVVAVREYAHQVKSKTNERSDFTETLYWNAGQTTDETGTLKISFSLCDSVSSFLVCADTLSAKGVLGTADTIIESRRPFYLEPKLPLEVSKGDICKIPVSIVNGTQKELQTELSLSINGALRILDPPQSSFILQAEARERTLLSLQVESGQAAADITLDGKAGIFRDRIKRTLDTVSIGFPQENNFGGKLSGQTQHTVMIPDSMEEGSCIVEALVYPSPLASLEKAVEALLREPCGCFEQASSSTYPNIMVLQYLLSHSGTSSQLIKRASELVERGYKKLISYECSKKGYEWFGSDPGHEALTAYGLMEFHDMSEVFPVESSMLERTQNWLLSRRDGSGGFLRDSKALDSFGRAPEEITNAYITWALSQITLDVSLEKESIWLKKKAETSKDAYFLALVANVLLNLEDQDANKVLSQVRKLQNPDGSFQGENTSITCSGGESFFIETTALSILALLKKPEYTESCQNAMHWLLERCKGGRFGATQATILALKAIIEFDKAQSSEKKPGKIRLLLDEKVLAESSFDSERQEPIALVWVPGSLSAKEHRFGLEMLGGAPMPYSLQIRYFAKIPPSSSQCKVLLKTSLSKENISEGLSLDLLVTLSNQTPETLPMTIAIIGIPGGTEARVDQLKEFTEEGKFDLFELRKREIILYWRGMKPNETKSFPLSLIASIPGQYTAPASRAYLYYTDEDKVWTQPLRLTITPDAGI